MNAGSTWGDFHTRHRVLAVTLVALTVMACAMGYMLTHATSAIGLPSC